MSKQLAALLGAGILALGLASSAYADGYSAPRAAYASPLSWTGFYVGATAGGAWSDTIAIDKPATNGLPWNALGDRFTAKGDGVIIGGTLGYNWQVGNILFGFEGDLGYLGDHGTGTSSLAANTQDKSDGGFYTTARARLGFVFDRTLVYGTGGYFGADLSSKVFTTNATLLTSSAGFQSGWTIGGGIEHMLASDWSMKIEYLHYDLGRDQVGGVCCGGGITQFFDIENKGDVVRLGLNYRFGDRREVVPLK